MYSLFPITTIEIIRISRREIIRAMAERAMAPVSIKLAQKEEAEAEAAPVAKRLFVQEHIVIAEFSFPMIRKLYSRKRDLSSVFGIFGKSSSILPIVSAKTVQIYHIKVIDRQIIPHRFSALPPACPAAKPSFRRIRFPKRPVFANNASHDAGGDVRLHHTRCAIQK